MIMTKEQQKALIKAISDYLHNGIKNETSTFIEYCLDNENEDLAGIEEYVLLSIEVDVENILNIICEGY